MVATQPHKSVVEAGPLQAALETLGLSSVEITQPTSPATQPHKSVVELVETTQPTASATTVGTQPPGPVVELVETLGLSSVEITQPTSPATTLGVGPWLGPLPDDPRYDPELLVNGDTRNVADEYRYWTVEAIRADLAEGRDPARQLHIAIENWAHDFNIGSIVRTANAFNAASVHILGRRRWNRRGAMVTDRYLDVYHEANVADLLDWQRTQPVDLPIIGIDNLPGSVPLETFRFPRSCLLIFGAESTGLTDEMQDACDALVAITQYGSTRSINAGAAAAIAMWAWSIQAHQKQ